MQLTPILARFIIALCAFSAAQLAAAQYYQGGSLVVRVGAGHEDTDESSISLVPGGLLAPDFHRSALDGETTWNVSGLQMTAEHWGAAQGGLDVPLSNLFLNWYFLDPGWLGRPYVGLGVNYIDSGGGLNRDGKLLLIDRGLATGRLGLGHSWGLAAQIGVDFRFSRDSAWVGNASLMYIDADTDINIRYPVESFAVPNRLFSEDFQYDPWIFNLGVGYTFSF